MIDDGALFVVVAGDGCLEGLCFCPVRFVVRLFWRFGGWIWMYILV